MISVKGRHAFLYGISLITSIISDTKQHVYSKKTSPPSVGLNRDAFLFLSPGQRGIRALFVQDELLRSCLALSHASSVAITTGFPTHFMHRYVHTYILNTQVCLNDFVFPFSPPDETDGPPGAIAMATMLLSLGKQVTLLTDSRALEMNRAIVDEAVRTGGVGV